MYGWCTKVNKMSVTSLLRVIEPCTYVAIKNGMVTYDEDYAENIDPKNYRGYVVGAICKGVSIVDIEIWIYKEVK